jgi:hypothetical protein
MTYAELLALCQRYPRDPASTGAAPGSIRLEQAVVACTQFQFLLQAGDTP